MRDDLTDHEWAAIGPMLEAARSSTGGRPSRSQWHLLGVAIWSTLARSARQFRSLYHCYNRSFDGGGLAFGAGT
jgi:transposase